METYQNEHRNQVGLSGFLIQQTEDSRTWQRDSDGKCHDVTKKR